ncbi:MAG: hypothetical protein CL481_07325 [Acidobacteria bacterium]|nr:hypothetical protein [Acidobacteriota bacterium]
MKFEPFAMERWQSTYEHAVRFNLSESGVEPLTLGELVELVEIDPAELNDTLIEYMPSDGSPGLRSAIAAMYPDATPNNVLVTNGGAEANFVTSWLLCEPGDDLVYLAPNYMQFPGLAANWGCTAQPLPLREETGWQPDLDELSSLVTDATKLILVTNPNNPTGAILSAAAMQRVVEVAESVGAWIIADEIYRGAELDGIETPTFWGRYDKVVITSGMSKAFGLPGLRIGWTIVPEDLREQLWARKDYTSIAMGSLSDVLATHALQPTARERIHTRTRGILNANLPILEDWLRERDGIFSWKQPQAGAIVYARYDLPIGGLQLAESMRTEADCLIVPGDHFNMPNYVRLGFGPSPERLRQALARCADVLDSLCVKA